MTSNSRKLLAIALLAAFSMPAVGTELSGYLTLTTDYVWRGVTQSDGDPALQLGGEVSFRSGVYAGLWGSTIDINNGGDRQRDAEVNYYIGYGHDVSAQWTLGVSAVAYTYPGQTGVIDYNYEEYGISVNHDDRVWLEYAYSPDYWGLNIESHNIELISEWAAGEHLVLGGAVGYFDFRDFLDDSYAYWDLGMTWPINRFSIDLRYHDTSDTVFIVSTPDRADARAVLSFRVFF